MRIYPIIALALSGALFSCGGSHKGAADEGSAATDSIAEAPEAVVALDEFPDTAYASAQRVSFTVDVADESIEPRLCSLDDPYADTPGAFTFRKGRMRQADFGGRVNGEPTKIEVDWRFKTGTSPNWGGGSGWTGQPVYVEWPDSCIARFRAESAGLTADFGPREIIVGSLSGSVYFINYETGKASREPIDGTNPIKGSVSLDPELNGNLYVGQGIPDERPFGAYVIDLYKHEVTDFFPEDPKAYRRWGAYDSSAARAGQFLIRPGENGVVYKLLVAPGKLTLQSALRYKVGGAAPGIESSIGICRNYGYVADNAGNILCINLNTMRPVWHYALGDDIDHSMVVIEEEGRPCVYTGTEIDKQGVGTARYVKLDGLTGDVIWRQEVEGKRFDIGEKHFDGGFYATALPGQGNCSGLIFASCVLNTKGQNGQLMAFDRATGEIKYATPLSSYGWSSPVAFLNEKDEMYIVVGDCIGNIYLMRGIDGEILSKQAVGNNFESSPVVAGNSLVVGTRGNEIIKMTVK